MSGVGPDGKTLVSSPPSSAMNAPEEPSGPETPRYEDPRLGTTLGGRYELTRCIGQGGMGRVYAGRHKVIGRNVAIKVLHAHLVEKPTVLRRFINEARAAGMIGHPNIVESIDFGTTDDGLPFLVLEFLEGTNLLGELQGLGPLPMERAVGIGLQIAGALEAAHAQKIVHRDLKAENVFLIERDGRPDHVKVLDFGISKFAPGPGEGQATSQGALLGTPQCMAPEQISSPDAIDERVDIYALGVLLYEMLCGETPFHGATFPGLLSCILKDAPPPLGERRPDLPSGLVSVVHKAMEKRRDDRFSSMEELYEALLPFAGPSPPPRFVARGSGKQAPSASAARVRLTPSTQPPESRQRKPYDPEMVIRPTERVVATTLGAGASSRGVPASNESSKRGLLVGALLTALAIAGGGAWYFGTRTATSSAPSASATGAPAAASSSVVSATKKVELSIRAARADTMVTLRGRTYATPFDEQISQGASEEPIEVSAPGSQGRRYWVKLDNDLSLFAQLPDGSGVVDATPTELAHAIASSRDGATASSASASAAASGGAATTLTVKPTTGAITTAAATGAASATPSAAASHHDISLER